jgi:hypothetical protein
MVMRSSVCVQRGTVAGEARGGVVGDVEEGIRLGAGARLFAGAEPSFSDDEHDLDRTQIGRQRRLDEEGRRRKHGEDSR